MTDAAVNYEVAPFSRTLDRHGLRLTRGRTTTLQINVGLRCNQRCRHCHLEAGPDRAELMDEVTVEAVIEYAQRAGFDQADITGGAPELNPHLDRLIEGLAAVAPRVMFRANLTALTDGHRDHLLGLLRHHKVVIVASFPSLSPSQADSQRGSGVFDRSLAALERLNEQGYGVGGAGLELNLVSNPAGAFLPPDQCDLETRFKKEFQRRWGLSFNHLFAFANMPLGRFRSWLVESGNLAGYMQKLESQFNPGAVDGVMCRTLVSIAWDGFLYDCDFNLALGLPLGGLRAHVSQMAGPPETGTPIAVGEHCYTCTAGSGFT